MDYLSEQKNNEKVVVLRIPTHFGYEKVAMATADALARQMGLPESRIRDLNTALSEAILNAMEHGNQMNQQLQIIITFTQTVGKLLISIRDQGTDFTPPTHYGKPDIKDKLSGLDSPRGWGWFLIEQLVDHVEVSPTPEGGTIIHLVIFLEDVNGRQDVSR